MGNVTSGGTNMSDFIIATASTADLRNEWLESHDIPFIPYTFEIEGEVFADTCHSDLRHLIYRKMREGVMPNTSQITSYQYYEFFKGLVETGKPVIFADMDKAISGSYYNSTIAAGQIREDYPDAVLEVMDTRCITTGLGLLVRKMAYMREDGHSFEEVLAWAKENQLKIVHRFLVDDLQWLRKGGRLSNASSIVGSLLSIKPLIYLPDDGSLVAYEKVRGKKKALAQLLASVKRDIDESYDREITLSHCDCLEEGRKWFETVKENFPNATIRLQELGPTIGSHIGPGFLSIVYFCDERRP